MDIAKYLETSLIEVFKQYYNIHDEIDGISFIKKYLPDILDDNIINSVYMLLRDEGNEEVFPKDKFMAILIRYYYLSNYGSSNQSVINYLMSTSYDDIFRLFLENKVFGMDLLKSYYKGIVDGKSFEGTRNKIISDGKGKDLTMLESTYSIIDICSLTNLLRRVLCNLYNHYIENGYSDLDALKTLWMYFASDYDPLRELDKYGFSKKEQLFLKRTMLGLIISDLYEDITNDPIVKSNEIEAKAAYSVPLISITLGGIGIPDDQEVINRMLKHFILLQDEVEKKKSNRRNTYDKGRIMQLKKVNPLYKLDELTF